MKIITNTFNELYKEANIYDFDVITIFEMTNGSNVNQTKIINVLRS